MEIWFESKAAMDNPNGHAHVAGNRQFCDLKKQTEDTTENDQRSPEDELGKLTGTASPHALLVSRETYSYSEP